MMQITQLELVTPNDLRQKRNRDVFFFLFFFLIGKIRVKIVTSKDALENMDGKNDLKLLSEREETQFRDMILGLLVSVGYKGMHQTVMSCSGCAFIVRPPS